MGLTTDRNDPDLPKKNDDTPREQAKKYLVLSDEQRAKGFRRPVRNRYVHDVCQTETTMGQAIAETYARDPWFYGGTYCWTCRKHRPLSEFHWIERDGSTGLKMDDYSDVQAKPETAPDAPSPSP